MGERPPRLRPTIFVGLLAVLLPGCTSNSQPRLEALANRLVPPGSKLSEATSRLTVAGFNCDPRAGAYTLTCTRMRNNAVLATCVQRINLSTDSADRFVSRIDVPPPACAGM